MEVFAYNLRIGEGRVEVLQEEDVVVLSFEQLPLFIVQLEKIYSKVKNDQLAE